MTTESSDFSRSLGFLEGQISEHSALLKDLREGQRELNAQLQQVNARIDRMFLATWAIGGGIIATLIGLLVTIIVRG